MKLLGLWDLKTCIEWIEESLSHLSKFYQECRKKFINSTLGREVARFISRGFFQQKKLKKHVFLKNPLKKSLFLVKYPPAKKMHLQNKSLQKSQGKHYDLKAIYDLLNQSYFSNQLNLEITWFGSAQRKARRHRKLGLFCFEFNRIKIHRLLDQPHFPPYFISYVVYHEMLHSICPPVKAKKGRYSIHHLDFKKREREFADYEIAKCWELENRRLFFYPFSENVSRDCH